MPDPWPRRLAILVALMAAAALPWLARMAHLPGWLDEGGAIEQASVAVWLACALALGRHRMRRSTQLALMGFFVALAIREAGLPPWLIPSGRALTRASHYIGPHSVEWWRALLELLAVIAFAWSIVRSLWHFAGFFRRPARWWQPDARLALAALATLALAQLADEGPGSVWLVAVLMLLAIRRSFQLGAGASGSATALFPHADAGQRSTLPG